METPQHAIDWFEIPVHDFDGAQSFYEALLAVPMRRETIAGQTVAVFGAAETSVGGCLMAGANAPSTDAGTLVYLNAGRSLDAVLARVAKAGGRITTPRFNFPATWVASRTSQIPKAIASACTRRTD
jgi:uncharacterized protein